MAYPILNSLTQDTADKIEALIDYGEIMTRGKYLNIHSVSEVKKSTIPKSSEKLCVTMLKIYVGILIMSTILRVTSVPSSPWRLNSTFDL